MIYIPVFEHLLLMLREIIHSKGWKSFIEELNCHCGLAAVEEKKVWYVVVDFELPTLSRERGVKVLEK